MMRRVITVPIDVSTISQTAFLRPTGAEPSLHRPLAGCRRPWRGRTVVVLWPECFNTY